VSNVISINPEFVERILNGTKLFEYRKFRCREDDVLNVWRQTKQHSGITYSFLENIIRERKRQLCID
jgi:hypothetical protein